MVYVSFYLPIQPYKNDCEIIYFARSILLTTRMYIENKCQIRLTYEKFKEK